MSDWIETFLTYTEGLPTPEIFRVWGGITAIGAALDRRVWCNAGLGPMYPNLYTFLVGPPGSGKTQVISPVKKLLLDVPKLHLAPDNVTKAALIDSLHKNSRVEFGAHFPNGLLEVHSIIVLAPELGVLISKHDMEFLSVLNHIFDSPPNYREERRSMEGRNPDITNPQLTILAGTQPDFLADTLPEVAWGQGFCARLMLIYAEKPPKKSLFLNGGGVKEHLEPSLKKGLLEMAEMYGEMSWTQEAKAELSLWYEHDMPPVPDHPKLHHYVTRRIMQALKLCTISAISRKRTYIIEVEDVKRVKTWMTGAETVMPDIFRAMLAKSDNQLIEEVHQHVYKIWTTEIAGARIPVGPEEVYGFLKDRVPSERMGRIIDVCEKLGLLIPNAGGGWIPKSTFSDPHV